MAKTKTTGYMVPEKVEVTMSPKKGGKGAGMGHNGVPMKGHGGKC